ncbi:MAG: right-handed parallel beta-helix repeat-containing protein [Nitrospinae bacterium]|nr:right-handed parallel beta-helix repeat-containing protein [Nitrospinota bacterium]
MLLLASCGGDGGASSRAKISQVSSSRVSFDIGSPSVTEIWVDPVNGSDTASGASRASALRTLSAAWDMVPSGQTLSTGYHIKLAAGTFTQEMAPNYWESRWGTFTAPVIIESVDGEYASVLPALNIYDCRYLYLVGVKSVADGGGGDTVHCEKCDHFLMRRSAAVWPGVGERPQEALKINQSSYVYIEDGEFSGGGDNAIDFVAVQYGHIVNNAIHDAVNWCMYLKGGSAYFRVEGNEYYSCGEGGFTAGQGTGFEYMVSPWIHYEAYDIKFVNNVIHDIYGAGIGVNGGYNVLMAFNTMYRVGERSHVIEAAFGSRSCDGDTARCAANLALGGWGTSAAFTEGEPVPNRNVYIYNNVVYNPAGYASAYQHFTIQGPRAPGGGSNIPSPAVTDTNLQIKGNIIWNGGAEMPLGVEDGEQGCQADNPTCNAAQLLADNYINKGQPTLANPDSGDFRPVTGGFIEGITAVAIPDFQWADAPATPAAPAGTASNSVPLNRADEARGGAAHPGAY